MRSGLALAGLNFVAGCAATVAHAVILLPHVRAVTHVAALIPLIVVVATATACLTIGWISYATDIFYEEIDLLMQDIRRSFVLILLIALAYVLSVGLAIVAIDGARPAAVLRTAAPAMILFCGLCLLNGAFTALLAFSRRSLTRNWPLVPWETARHAERAARAALRKHRHFPAGHIAA